jgi:hypothetical protein
VVSVKPAHPMCFLTGTERPRLKKKPIRFPQPFIPSWLVARWKSQSRLRISAKSTNRLSASQWAFFTNLTVRPNTGFRRGSIPGSHLHQHTLDTQRPSHTRFFLVKTHTRFWEPRPAA